MDDELLIEQIKAQLYTKTGNINSAVLRQPGFDSSELYQSIKEKTKFLDEQACCSERIYCIVNKTTSQQRCKACNKPLKWKGYKNKPYSKTCSNNICKRASTKWKSCKDGKINTEKNKKNGFVEILNSNHELVSHDALMAFCLERIQQPNSIFNTALLRTHSTHLSTLLKIGYIKYGDDIKWSQVFYNFIHNIHTPPKCHKCGNHLNFRNSKFGYSSCHAKRCSQQLVAESKKKNRIKLVTEHFLDNGYELITNHGINEGKHHIKHQTCGHEFTRSISSGQWQNTLICPQCNPRSSAFELEVYQYIKTLGLECINNSRDVIPPKEIDIFIPSKNIAIECNGIYWHNESNGKDKNYHRNKYMECKAKNIQLIQIWESEWQTKQQIVKSIIDSKLGISKRIFGRKCTIHQITDRHEKVKFLDENHIQGNDNSQISYGLYHDSQLVSMMTFGHRKIVKGDYSDWEMIRFCNKLNHTVIGGASRLLKYFINTHNPQNIITYADLRYSNGDLYHKLGFKHKHDSKPGYWYVINNTLKHRSGFMKHRLHKVLKEYDENLSEYQNMLNNGFDRIWDCGHAVFVYKDR